jgi:RimJ/RimL family protein N-acetyltransferase
MWAVVERATGTLVGRAGFWFPEGWPGFELGWLIGRPYWGRGYATEAARECLRHAFWNMQRDHVISIIHPDNHRSIRVAERIGEQREGTVEILGTQALVYGILRPESAEP